MTLKLKPNYRPVNKYVPADVGNCATTTAPNEPRIVRENCQYSPEEQAEFHRACHRFRSAIVAIDSKMAALKAEIPYHNHLLDRQLIGAAITDLKSALDCAALAVEQLP